MPSSTRPSSLYHARSPLVIVNSRNRCTLIPSRPAWLHRLAGYEDGTSEELALLQCKANDARYAISDEYLGLLAPAIHPNGHYVWFHPLEPWRHRTSRSRPKRAARSCRPGKPSPLAVCRHRILLGWASETQYLGRDFARHGYHRPYPANPGAGLSGSQRAADTVGALCVLARA